VSKEGEGKHQRVVMTRWCWWWRAVSKDGEKRHKRAISDSFVLEVAGRVGRKTPTSRSDSLVVVATGVRAGWQGEPTNESV
jgi:hypothetical protein